MQKWSFLSIFLSVFILQSCLAQKAQTLDSLAISAAKFRSVGPAFMTGRISDVVIDPADESHWYVGVASGGVWETVNAGVTFKPIFDGQKVYSIGCVTLDAHSRNLWVGTGENVGGRHISFGDGVYLSRDGGKTWKNMGLAKSNHISKIIVDPKNSDRVWVAAQGPLWSSGGERGVYMTVDGGKEWKQVLGDDEWTGATDLLIDPRDANVLYAATWQRHRTVAAYLGGGPQSGIHKSTDGGLTWEKLKTGLPSGNMGKIGLAMSPQNPDVLYAAIELDLKKGAFYRTDNGGMSWEKRIDIISGGTGPHYYQELWASPHQFDRVYFANNYLKVSNDGGKTFQGVGKAYKHVDNHAMAFRMSDPDYLMVGTDGGLYESFDLDKTWRHMGNLPITQFYKLAVDDALPFYNIYGGTQDNNTQGGKSRTENAAGISNADWKVIMGGDGHQPATEPGNPNIVYAQSQQGYYTRIDMATGERIGIRPQPAEGEDYERYNWDAPILVSSHNPAQIYVASQRLWMSEDRGDTWQSLSGDLTRDEERFDLPIMGRKQSFENSWDVYAMSTYNTITSIAESPKNINILYIGTDDGLIQATKDGGKTWEQTDIKSLPGVPERAYINDIKADLFDENKVYMAVDAHKQGDYTPYLFVSINGGKSWKSITEGIAEKNYVWRIVQDHVDPSLLFIGTEFGVYFSNNGGEKWKQLKGGLPTISFRDLAIQRRENDLVAASFGRSFYILDDYSFLRNLSAETLEKEAALFPVRDAYLFRPRNDGRQKSGSLGGQHFYGDNPEHGALISYYIKEKEETSAEKRKKSEKELNQKEKDIDFPGWEALDAEKLEKQKEYWLAITDSKGRLIRQLKLSNSKGVNRLVWDIKATNPWPVYGNTKNDNAHSGGWYVAPGTYSAKMYSSLNGKLTPVSESVSITLKPLHESTLPEKSRAEKDEFVESYMAAQLRRNLLQKRYREAQAKSKALIIAATRVSKPVADEVQTLAAMQDSLVKLKNELYGSESKSTVGEKQSPTLGDRLGAAGATLWGSSYGPTATAIDGVSIATKLLTKYEAQLEIIEDQLEKVYASFRKAGAPVIVEME